MTDDAADRKVIVAQCRNGLCAGAYAIEGNKLKLGSDFGSPTTMLGLQKPDKLARKMLRHVCDAASVGADDPRLLKTRPRVRQPRRVAGFSVEPAVRPPPDSPPTSVDGPPTNKDERVSA